LLISRRKIIDNRLAAMRFCVAKPPGDS